MNDGSHLGISAGDAFNVIIGKEIPEESKRVARSPEEMLTYLEGAMMYPEILALEDVDQGYNEAARFAGKAILYLFRAHPHLLEIEPNEEINEAIRAIEPCFLFGFGLSGFQVGWGLNAAKFALGKPAGSNPALITVTKRAHE